MYLMRLFCKYSKVFNLFMKHGMFQDKASFNEIGLSSIKEGRIKTTIKKRDDFVLIKEVGSFEQEIFLLKSKNDI